MHSFYRSYGKRAIDLVLSGVGAIVLLPLFLIIAALIKLESMTPMMGICHAGVGKR